MARLLQLMAFLMTILLLACSNNAYVGNPSTAGNTAATLVRFEMGHSLSAIMEKAERSDKLVFVDVYADWCAPCKMMDRDVFTHRQTADLLNRNFINYKVDVERGNGPDLAVLYGVHVYPTLLFLDQDGRVLARKDGAAYQSEIKGLVQKALAARQGVSAR